MENDDMLNTEFVRVFTGNGSESIEYHEAHEKTKDKHCVLIIDNNDCEQAQIWLTTKQLKMFHNSLNRALLKRVRKRTMVVFRYLNSYTDLQFTELGSETYKELINDEKYKIECEFEVKE